MVAKWQRINPAGLLLLGQKGGIMIMATAAKKHVTIFPRSRRAPGAGHPDVKAAFTVAAHKTLGIESRAERNAIISRDMVGKGPGQEKYVSKARKGSKLYKKVTVTPTR